MSIYDIRSETTGITSNVKRIMEEKKISIVALSNETKLSTKIIERARTGQIKLCKLETLAIIAKGLDHGCAWQCLSGEGLGGKWWVEL